MRLSLRRSPPLQFVALAAIVIAVSATLLRSRGFASEPHLAAFGVTFDLTISFPLLYWLFFVRTGKARRLTIVPVFLLGLVVASLIVPAAHQDFLRQLRTIVLPLVELTVLTFMILKFRSLRREWKSSAVPDPYERIRAAARSLAGDGRAAELLASEPAMLYYATAGWRLRPENQTGEVLTFHKRSGWDTIVAAILLMLAAEGVGMHLLISLWSPVGAWIWTGLDLWAVVWILGDYHALRVRRTYVDDEGLHIRLGVRWNAVIPRALVASIEPVAREEEWNRKDVLKVTVLEEPFILLTLREPVVVEGMLGIRRSVRAVALAPDQDDALASLRRALAPHV